MRKNKLLVAAAVAALTAGSSIALAQAPSGEHQNPASKNAPAEKMAPAAKSNSEQKGAQQGGQPNSRMGQENKSPSQTTGQAPNQRNERMGQDNKSKSPTTGQAQHERNGQAGEKNKSTTGQAPRERNERMGEKNQRNERSTTGQGANEQKGAPKSDRLNTQGNQRNQPSGTTGQGATGTRGGAAGGASVTLSSEQKTRIHEVIIKDRSAPRVDRVDFALSVGTRVPRGKVHFAPLPTQIIEIEPTWRGYEYFLVGDQIIVVNPRTDEIVAVLPA